MIQHSHQPIQHSHQTAPTQFVDAAGIRFAYRRFGKTGGAPLVFNMLGGLIAQELALNEPQLVRRLILVGTGPRSGEGMASLTPEAQQIFGARYDEPDHLWLKVFFTASEVSQTAGRAYLKRFRLRVDDRDPEVSDQVAPAQLEALAKWGAPREKPFEYLKAIAQPTLVVNGGTDVIVYPVNSWILQQHLPHAQLILYPDANHGSQYQYPERFVQHASLFLSEEDARASARR
jgi:pimeloyl-ACP methyl ester carboxylesterase